MVQKRQRAVNASEKPRDSSDELILYNSYSLEVTFTLSTYIDCSINSFLLNIDQPICTSVTAVFIKQS